MSKNHYVTPEKFAFLVEKGELIRMSYPDANVFVNAPLALHQVSQKAKLSVLKWVLEE